MISKCSANFTTELQKECPFSRLLRLYTSIRFQKRAGFKERITTYLLRFSTDELFQIFLPGIVQYYIFNFHNHTMKVGEEMQRRDRIDCWRGRYA
jgi:hypothetical protein